MTTPPPVWLNHEEAPVPHRKVKLYLGTRGQLLLWCAAVWGLVAYGIAVAPPADNDVGLFYQHIPLWLRVLGWGGAGVLATYAAVTKCHVRAAVGLLMVMPVLRVTSHAGAWVGSIFPWSDSGVPYHAHHSVGYYLLMVWVVLITSQVKEPIREGTT